MRIQSWHGVIAAGGLFALSAFPGAAAREKDLDWPQFRGPTGQGMSQARDVPIHWNSRSNVVWKAPVPGLGWSSPILARGRVYLTTSVQDASGISLRAVCLDSSDGTIVWDKEVFRPDAGAAQARHQKNSLASPTPLFAEGTLYVHFGHLGTAALNANGEMLWRQDELRFPPVHGNGGSPVLVEGLLVFTCDGANNPFVAAVEAKTGRVRWKTPRNSNASRTFSFGTPLVIELDGEKQIVSPASALVAAYRPSDGAELWRVRYPLGYSLVPCPVFADGILCLSTGFDNPLLYAIGPQGAKGDATDKNVLWIIRKGVPTTPSLLAAGTELYYISDGGIASCADLRTGKVHWSERLGGHFSASPVYAEGRVYFQDETGTGYVIRAGKQFELLARNELEEPSLASYAVADGTLYIRTEKHLWRIGGARETAAGRSPRAESSESTKSNR